MNSDGSFQICSLTAAITGQTGLLSFMNVLLFSLLLFLYVLSLNSADSLVLLSLVWWGIKRYLSVPGIDLKSFYLKEWL